MTDPPIPLEKAQAVDAELERMEAYLWKLKKRLKEIGVLDSHCLPGWVEHAHWGVSGFRHHFARWAIGPNGDRRAGLNPLKESRRTI